MKRAKRLKRFAVYLLARALAGTLSILPTRAAVELGAKLGQLAYLLARKDRRRAIEQIERALGLDHAQATALAKRVFANAGRTGAELAILPRLDLRSYVALEETHRALLTEALAAGRGAIFVSAHLGAFELLAQRIAGEGFDCATLARKGPNPFLGEWIVERRKLGGVETINRGEPRAPRKILSALRRGAVIGALVDQDTKVESVHVPFFGQLAKTPIAPAELALKLDLPVIAGFIRREPHGHAIRLERIDLQGATDVREATARITAVIERAIRAAPDEWVWFHARWKTPPPAG